MAARNVVIVGAGHAGGVTAEALREQGYDGRLTLVGAEPHRPYERPPLSKGFLLGDEDRSSMDLHDESWYADQSVELRLGTGVTALDRSARTVELADGALLDYDQLVLATGSSPRRLDVPGADAPGVHYLRRVDDSERLRALLTETGRHGGRIVIVGGGWIGLEVAAAARAAGAEVTVLEAAELPLLAVLGTELAQVFARLHTDHGVTLRTGVEVSEITADGPGGRANAVRLTDGTSIEADGVVVGVGAVPETGLARSAGLDVGSGVHVDAAMRTSDPAVFAVGDIAAVQHPRFGRRLRHEHWASAVNQPPVAAAAMLGGDASYRELPYFFTDQYDLGMEMYGAIEPGVDEQLVLRGDVAGLAFAAFWLRGNQVVAAMHVNLWDLGEQLKPLVESGRTVDPRRLADPDSALPT